MPKSGPRLRKYGSKDGTKLRIISYLYSHSEGANQNTINSLPGLNSQRWDIIKDILSELFQAGAIVIENHDEIKKGAVIYKITAKGKETVEKLKDLQKIGLGSTFDLFKGLEE